MARHGVCLVPLFATAAVLSTAATLYPVEVRETKITIPTYLAAAPEPNPMFFFGRESQGAQGPVYPYPMYDILTGRKVDKTYTIVYLENEYIRIGILPEIGGRIFEGVDKTNGYNFIYRQHVIKPALIGLIGAWISGGLEWNIPHHHRASTFNPVQYSVEDNADGSRTVWVGELEVRQRMRWAVGYTLRPGRSYLEASVRILNRTPLENSMLCFANLAVHANENYQVIFPPGTQFGTYHGKREFTAWPVSTSKYAGADFSRGVDISWYRNHVQANSVFAWNYEDDFFAGYDHGREAGTMSVADHNIAPGKKFWTWGNGPFGRTWDKILTDEDGPYLELMTGAYSDNQPDYSWLAPYETRSFALNWYPFRGIGGVKKANLEAAVNLEVAGTDAKVGFYTTAAHPAAEVLLKAGERVLLRETVGINPATPFVRRVALPSGIDEHDLTASLSDAGRELVSYTPVRLEAQAAPTPVTPPPAPADVASNEELYLIGLRAVQFHDPKIDPLLYWNEALRRDPGDSRVNTELGIQALRKARYAEAEAHFRTALRRVTDRYTAPKDSEAFYYLGVALKAEGKLDEASGSFFRATWSQAWKAPAYYSLAEIATGRGDMKAALDLLDRSIDANALNIRALNLKAAVLRHLDRSDDARQLLLSAAHRADPLDVRSMAELWLASNSSESAQRFAATASAFRTTAEETAAEYLDAGLWQDGMNALGPVSASAGDPMLDYYLAWFASKVGRRDQAAEYYRRAAAMPPDYVFPFQNEAIDVLEAGVRANAADAHAPYYLGNLLYDWQPERAAEMWRVSAQRDASFAIVHRNLAVAYIHQKPAADSGAAIAELEKAVGADRKYPLHFAELDELYEQAGTPVSKRLALLDRNADIVAARDDSENRAIALKVVAGQYDEAIRIMTARPFAVVEGTNLNVAEHWADAHTYRAQREIDAGHYADALTDLGAALAVPANLPLGFEVADRRRAEVAYWRGVAYERSGRHGSAVENWRRAAADEADCPGECEELFYKGLALAKVGASDDAARKFQVLISAGEKMLDSSPAGRVPQARAHVLIALGCLGLGDGARSRAELEKAVQINPAAIGAPDVLAVLGSHGRGDHAGIDGGAGRNRTAE
ncbi:MAG TPA: DUF5107 domain-containing protein [Bryobacteraceae bacterium]|nr:DUF5107 domain-containing protein [Bryobacteraceae bacterium]